MPSRAAIGILLALAAGGAVRASDQVPGETQSKPILLRGGDLYTVSQGVLRGTDLLFEHGTIRTIRKGIEPPAGAEVLDVRGKRVYPGLIAPYSQIGLIEIGAVRATDDQDELGDVTPEVAAHTAYNPDSEVIPTVRAHGITTVQVVPRGSLIRGLTFLVNLDGWTKEDAAIELVDGLQLSWPAETRSRRGPRRSAEERREERDRALRVLREAFASAKAYDLARRAEPELPIDLRWEAMRGAFSGELPVYIAADGYGEIIEAVAFGEEHGLRIVLIGARDADQLTDLLKEHAVPVILASSTGLPLRNDDEYDRTHRLPTVLHEAGVRFALGHITRGAWDLRNLPLQAGQAVAFGLPADVALRAITLSTAEILGISRRQGSLDIGKKATLFVSEGDVMDTLTQRVTLMFIEGRRVDLDNRHKTLYRKYREKRFGP